MKIIDLLEGYDLLIESFSSVAKKFKENGIDDSLADTYIEKFKALSKRNAITGKERDIGYWSNKPWDSFQEFIDTKESIPSKRQAKRQIKKDAITVLDNEDWSVIIPLTTESSKIYGSNTKWCTGSYCPDNNSYFIEYTSKNILYYMIDKRKNVKYAVLVYQETDKIHRIFDELDKVMTSLPEPFSEDQFKEWNMLYKNTAIEGYISPYITTAKSAYEYSILIGKRIPVVEKEISNDPQWSLEYSTNVIKGRFRLGEQAISTNAEYSFKYADTIIKGRFPLGERSISTSAKYSFRYADSVIHSPFPQGEKCIASDPNCAVLYARYILKGRFPEGEEAILRSKYAPEYRELFLTGEEA